MTHTPHEATPQGSFPDDPVSAPQSRARSRLPRRNGSASSRTDDAIRWFLVIWTAILTLLIILAYLVTHDIRVLFGGTIVAIAVSFVYAYYFWRRPTGR